jgi:Effector Associated Constant Component 1
MGLFGSGLSELTGGRVKVSAADVDDLDALYEELRGTPGLTVEAELASQVAGDQGPVLEFLTVACSGGAITVFLQIIKALAESRSPKFSLKIRRGRERLEVTADNVDDVLPVIRELLDDP